MPERMPRRAAALGVPVTVQHLGVCHLGDLGFAGDRILCSGKLTAPFLCGQELLRISLSHLA